MQLQTDLWIEGSYYLDFDHLGQMRIVGPNNHLHFGSVGLYRDKIKIDSVYSEKGELVIKGKFLTAAMFMHDPVVAHVQKVRHFIDRPGAKPSFEAVMKKNPQDLVPNYIGLSCGDHGYEISYKRLYQQHWYGVLLTVDPDVEVVRSERRRGFNMVAKTNDYIGFEIVTDSDQKPHSKLGPIIHGHHIDVSPFGDQKQAVGFLLDRTGIEISHLVRSNKTSGFDYGTVFPRDWMESADLGRGDLEPTAIRYMYHKAFEYVSPQGVGWHENIVGEFEFEKQQEVNELSASLDALVEQSSRIGTALKDLIEQVQEMYVVRNMVDIEPRYILGLDELSTIQFADLDLERVRRVARYIVMQAEHNHLITFKKIPSILRRHKHDEYYNAGNWRDSMHGFQMIHPIIAPYDVNVVFYPQALKVILHHSRTLGVDRGQLEALIDKWSRVKDWYRFTSTDGKPAYALALYDIKPVGNGVEYKKLEINHIDQAYEMFYGQPTEADTIIFCHRLLDPNYFYTPSGPLLVGAHEKGFDSSHYHGKVIWTKQTAYIVAGLHRQLELSDGNKWKASTKALLAKTIIQTAKASIDAWLKMGGVPELHYDKGGKPFYYNDQPSPEGPMNTVQLWSAVGARRIIRTYLEVIKHGTKLSHHGSGRRSTLHSS